MNQLCIVVWEVEDEVKWFVGYVKERLDTGRYIIEHLHRFPGKHDDFWNYPGIGDTQTVSDEQIIPCKVHGDWKPINKISTRIDFKSHLKNSAEIENTFEKLMDMQLMHLCSYYYITRQVTAELDFQEVARVGYYIN